MPNSQNLKTKQNHVSMCAVRPVSSLSLGYETKASSPLRHTGEAI